MCNTLIHLNSLNKVFPKFKVSGEVAHHDCAECANLEKDLKDKAWSDLENDFLKENYDALPLLSSEAFSAFVPAWLRYSLTNPYDEVSEYLFIHLGNMPKTCRFSREQARVILEIVDYLFKEMPEFYLDEEATIDQKKIHHVWQSIAA